MVIETTPVTIWHESKPQDEFLDERFGKLFDMSNVALVELALSVRSKHSTDNTQATAKVIEHWIGTYNLIHIVEFSDGLKYVVRVPASARHGTMTEAAQRALITQAHMMRFVKKRTMIPMPNVFDFDAGFDNIIQAPYIVMSYIPGRMVAEAWFDRTGPVPLEEKRLRILNDVAEAVAQLRGFQFDQIGFIEGDEAATAPGGARGRGGHQPIPMGPCFGWEENYLQDTTHIFHIEQCGPFTSSAAYLRNRLQRTTQWVEGIPDRGCRVLLDLMIDCLPRSTRRHSEPRESFVLSIPDLSAKNVLVDEQGRVTGFVDWDDVHTMPRFLGYAGFPGWIITYLNPQHILYAPEEHDQEEDSPELLKQYRRLYNRKMQTLLRGSRDARFVHKSHYYQAVHSAICTQRGRLHLVSNLVAKAFPTDLGMAMDLILLAGQGKLSTDDKDQLTHGFQMLFAVSG
ncbi:uncharacterized protein BP01DRAFT_397375 [Aspergillus saccharolyticus JOP 1030-1]|uniref:Aminoglycoside phosphotransferase domain-containing protein n=1 Tax=Aspergillus saccharolyticus JOP 1030-1 TaxID=1450539 RepID=A0A318ZNY5_9EURO|nr:hypothetical protein BP01DRAFT_397375 [Aspergillus saccharolyticus JOP 1030-1]PYH46163.1 hypothetical protein BP01DRAFT_397375 [Aspergillus saccharolyticus JOP 1030-1]